MLKGISQENRNSSWHKRHSKALVRRKRVRQVHMLQTSIRKEAIKKIFSKRTPHSIPKQSWWKLFIQKFFIKVLRRQYA